MTSWNKGIPMSDAAKKKNAKTYAAKRLAITYTEKTGDDEKNFEKIFTWVKQDTLTNQQLLRRLQIIQVATTKLRKTTLHIFACKVRVPIELRLKCIAIIARTECALHPATLTLVFNC